MDFQSKCEERIKALNDLAHRRVQEEKEEREFQEALLWEKILYFTHVVLFVLGIWFLYKTYWLIVYLVEFVYEIIKNY